LISPAGAQQSYDHRAIIRGDRSQKRLALVFTGGDYGEGTEAILDTLRRGRVRAGLFVTGSFLRAPGHAALLRRALREGHYVGPHSDQHLLYCDWNNREHSLVTEQEFTRDLARNLADLRKLGALRKRSAPVLFIPPYEWFNEDQVRWSRAMNVTLFNFTPGSGSNRDYLPESDPRFVSSAMLLRDILAYEQRDPAGLNGFILLLHLGADRKDKMYRLLPELIRELRNRGYEFVRIDELLGDTR
jgi:peptidoglycan/xylan/chitin deacetylase (PgdA/CDA1 family)